MKLKSLAALMMAGVMVLGLCACNSTTPDTSGSDSTPVSITTTESWDFSTVLSFFVYITPQGAYIPISNQVGSAQKLFGIGVLKYLQIPIPLTAFDQFPVLHHMNFVRKIKRRVNLMGNEKITALFFLLNSF